MSDDIVHNTDRFDEFCDFVPNDPDCQPDPPPPVIPEPVAPEIVVEPPEP